MTRFQCQLRLARSENKETKDFNRLMEEKVEQDRDFHIDIDADRSWMYDGLQIVRISKLGENKSIGRSRPRIDPEYSIWVPDYCPATRWEPEVHDAHETEDRFATLVDALFECYKMMKQYQYGETLRCEWEVGEAKLEASGYYEEIWG